MKKHSELYETIYNQLPRSWNDVTLSQFQKLMKCKISEDQDELNGMYNTIEVIHQLTGTPHDQIEGLSMLEVSALANKMEFLSTKMELVEINNCKIKWLKIEEINMDKYIQFVKTEDHMVNLHNFIKQFSKNGFTDEEIDLLPISEVMTGFFLFRTELMKSVIASMKSTKVQLKKHLKKEQHQSNQTKQNTKNRFINKLVGIFSLKK